MKEALYYEKGNDGVVRCFLCPHHCRISPGKVGICKVRQNIDGRLYSENYGKVSSINLDPIEKKPLYHFHPGSIILSIGSYGCNFRCNFCQNWQIAQQTKVATEQISAEEIVNIAVNQKNNIGIAYTYNEPSIWYEYVLDCAKLARQADLKNILVTNGFIEKEPLESLLPYIDAMNIDVKAFNDNFYKNFTSGDLSSVKQTIEIAQDKCHVEITTLLIPGINDSEAEIKSLAKWIANLRKDIPLHLTRYFPNYKMDLPATPVETIKNARELAKKYLDYVYTGNILDDEGNNTYCPQCGTLLVKRTGYLTKNLVKDKKCHNCGKPISIVE